MKQGFAAMQDLIFRTKSRFEKLRIGSAILDQSPVRFCILVHVSLSASSPSSGGVRDLKRYNSSLPPVRTWPFGLANWVLALPHPDSHHLNIFC